MKTSMSLIVEAKKIIVSKANEKVAAALVRFPLFWSEFQERAALQAVRDKRLKGDYYGAKNLLEMLPTKRPATPEEYSVRAARLDNEGRIYHDLGKFADAEIRYHHALDDLLRNGKKEDSGSERSERKELNRRASILNNLGHNYTVRDDDLDDFSRSEDLFKESLGLYLDLKNTEGIAYVLIHVGEMFCRQGDLNKSRKVLMKALRLEEQIKNDPGRALAYHQLAKVEFMESKSSDYKWHLSMAHKFIMKEPLCRRIRADIAFELGFMIPDGKSSHYIEEARALYSSMNPPPKVF